MCFTVNYIMGTGFLTLPWAFNSAGIGLSLATLGCVCFLSNISKDYVLETMARADALFRARSSSTNRPISSLSIHSAVDLVKMEGGKVGLGGGGVVGVGVVGGGGMGGGSGGGSRAQVQDDDDINATESTGLLSNNDSSQPAHQVMDRKFEIVEVRLLIVFVCVFVFVVAAPERSIAR